MRINHNLMAMNTHRQMGINQMNSGKNIEKLSSGMRINRAGDDAAGLAISEKMRAQIRGLNQASRNAQDGISLIQTAEGALQETEAILQRMRELSVQASNDTNVTTDREALQNEIEQLREEIDRIGNTTEFNTQKLLNGNVSETSVRKSFSSTTLSGQTTFSNVKIDASSEIATGNYTIKAVGDTKKLGGMSDAMHNIGVDNVEVDGGTSLSEGQYFVKISAERTQTLAADNSAYVASTVSTVMTNNKLAMDGTLTISTTSGSDTITVKFTSTSGTASKTVTFTRASGNQTFSADFSALGTVDVNLTLGTAMSTSGTWVGNVDVTYNATLVDSAGNTIGSDVAVNGGDEDIVIGQASTGKTVTVDFDSALLEGEASFSVKSTGVASAQLINSAGTTVDSKLISANDSRVDFSNGITFATGTISDGDTVSVTVSKTVEDKSLAFQIGSNSNQDMGLAINDMRSNALGIDNIDVTSRDGAVDAIDTLDEAISKVSAERSKLGAIQNRLEHSIKNIDTSSENLQAAESRIRDVDMAKEMMEFNKNNILQQAAQAMLAQANQAPQGVLQLLR